LKKVHRQSDREHSKILNQLRFGFIEEKYLELIKTRILPTPNEDDFITTTTDVTSTAAAAAVKYNTAIVPPFLCPTKNQAQQINETRLRKIPTETVTYKAIFENMTQQLFERTVDDSTIPRELKLKVGAQVACIKNLKVIVSKGGVRQYYIYNGMKGKVLYFGDKKTSVSTEDTETDENQTGSFPVIQFEDLPEPVMIDRVTWKFDLSTTKVSHKNSPMINQLPLRLSWADTIHSCQGITTTSVNVDLGPNSQIFENGQAYVALSRVRSWSGLYLLGFDPSKIVANPIALDFTIRICEKAGAHKKLIEKFRAHIRNQNPRPIANRLMFDCTNSNGTLVDGTIARYPNIHRLNLPSSNSRRKDLDYLCKNTVSLADGTQSNKILDNFTTINELLGISPI
jgi:hypothetical protein